MSVDPAVVALVRTVADLLTRWADAHITPPLPPPDQTQSTTDRMTKDSRWPCP